MLSFFIPSLPLPITLATTNVFSITIDLSFPEWHITEGLSKKSFETYFFHSELCIWNSSKLLCVSKVLHVFFFFLLLSIIKLFGYTTVC